MMCPQKYFIPLPPMCRDAFRATGATLYLTEMATMSPKGLFKCLGAYYISSSSLASIAADANHDPLAVCLPHLADLAVQLTASGHDAAYR
jgi:hypothetical protein